MISILPDTQSVIYAASTSHIVNVILLTLFYHIYVIKNMIKLISRTKVILMP